MDVAERLADVRGRISAAAERAGRSAHVITLVAVSKRFGLDAIAEARQAGQVDFGESRAQELKRKVADPAAAPGGELGLRWHFVGRLQRNKVGDVVGIASLVHSVDRFKLAEAIAERAERRGTVQRVLVQVNAADDPAKAGVPLAEAASFVAKVRGLPRVACQGLMTMPAFGGDPRPAFRRMRELRDELRERFPEVQHLSMGMSADYEIAIEEGATIVRIGEAIFGPRPAAGNDEE